MKKSLFRAILFTATLFLSTNLFAETGELYCTIQPDRDLMLGVEQEGDFKPNSATTYFHFGVGATEHLDVNLKYGVTSQAKPYYGIHLEYHFIKDDIVKFAISSGWHYRNGNLFDITPVFGHEFEDFSLATGPEFNWKFTNNKQWMLDWFVGINLPLPNHTELGIAVGVPIHNDTYWISVGWFVYF